MIYTAMSFNRVSLLNNKKLSIIAGILCGCSFAPTFFLPGIFSLSILCAQIRNSIYKKNAAIYGYLFGFGLYLSTIYWVSFGVSVCIDQFWWVVPLSFIGIPAFFSIFYCLLAILAWQFRGYILFHFIFCIIWLLLEWTISWIFTGLPWVLMGYSLSTSIILIQSSSIFGILGLSFIVVYIGSSLYSEYRLYTRLLVSSLIIIVASCYGVYRLEQNKTEFSKVKVRIVQPSISQNIKWNAENFWQNLDQYLKLSKQPGNPDIIIWSESALTVPYYHESILNTLKSIFTGSEQVLLFGSVNDNKIYSKDYYKIYSSLVGLDSKGIVQFDYYKSHLVPFGEYMPYYIKYFALQKLTYGSIDYSPGRREVLHLKLLNLQIQPLICYEAIFFNEVRIENNKVDLMVNITNDAWYGNTSGPYQHFEISKMRAIENGLPMIRAGNNGISAVIDPLGRVLKKLELNKINIIDCFLPLKLSYPTIFSNYGQSVVLGLVFFTLMVQLLVTLIFKAK